MRGRKPMLPMCLLAVWLISQIPCVSGLIVMVHGSHHATAMQLKDRVVLVFTHQPTESNPDHRHDDHVVSFSIEENYLRRVTSDGQPLLHSVPLITPHVLAAPEIDRDIAGQANLDANHAPPLFALRTVVLMV